MPVQASLSISSPSTTICLCMIVKNEAHVIERCLASVRPVIDHWIIVDTGSTDGTQDVIKKAMAGIPGRVVEQPWQDFAYNRTQALTLSRECAQYSLIIDADDVLELPSSMTRERQRLVLKADGYKFGIRLASLAYERTQLVNNKYIWCYKGILHEYLHCDDDTKIERLPWTINCMPDGQRRCGDNSTYRRDAELLEKALLSEKDVFLRSRYTFYLAQSWRDCGEQEKALQAYLQRATQGFWSEEVFISLLQAGRLQLALNHNADEVLQTFALATATCPHRAEASHDAARLCRKLDRFKEGYTIATQAVQTANTIPEGGLFVEPWIYHYGLKDELSIHAYYTNRFKESLQLSLDLLASENMPVEYRERIVSNARFAIGNL